MDAAAAYMVWMERLYAFNLAVAANGGNDSGRGRWGAAGAPGGDGIAHVNGEAVAAAAVVEEEEEVAVDRDGDRVADSDGGPVAHGAPRAGRMTTTTAATAAGGESGSSRPR